MCLVFPVKFVNLVVYMTTPETHPPRIGPWELHQFLGNVANEGQTRTWTAEGRAELRRAAERSLEALGPCTSNELMAPQRLREVVAPLKGVLADHLVFALPAGVPHHGAATQKFISMLHYAAAASRTANNTIASKTTHSCP